MYMKTVLLVLIFFLNVFRGYSQDNFQDVLYQLYINDRMIEWEGILEKMKDRLLVRNDNDLHYELLLAEYGFIGYCINVDQKEKAGQWLESAESDLEKLLSRNPGRSSLYAIKAALYGFQISLSPVKAVFLGPRNQRNIDKAIELDPLEPMGWFEYGNSEFFRPAAFGGSRTKAIEYYQKAIRLFEKKSSSISGEWFYLNMLMMLAYAYEKTEQVDHARKTYEKILRVEPDFTGLKEKLR